MRYTVCILGDVLYGWDTREPDEDPITDWDIKLLRKRRTSPGRKHTRPGDNFITLKPA